MHVFHTFSTRHLRHDDQPLQARFTQLHKTEHSPIRRYNKQVVM